MKVNLLLVPTCASSNAGLGESANAAKVTIWNLDMTPPEQKAGLELFVHRTNPNMPNLLYSHVTVA